MKFLLGLVLVAGVFSFTGCKEKSVTDKMKDGIEEAKEAVEDAIK